MKLVLSLLLCLPAVSQALEISQFNGFYEGTVMSWETPCTVEITDDAVGSLPIIAIRFEKHHPLDSISVPVLREMTRSPYYTGIYLIQKSSNEGSPISAQINARGRLSDVGFVKSSGEVKVCNNLRRTR